MSIEKYRRTNKHSNESQKIEEENTQALMRNWIDGLLICHSIQTNSSEHLKLQMNKGIPIVHFYRVSMDTNTSKVMTEDLKGAEEITNHVIEQVVKELRSWQVLKTFYSQKRK